DVVAEGRRNRRERRASAQRHRAGEDGARFRFRSAGGLSAYWTKREQPNHPANERGLHAGWTPARRPGRACGAAIPQRARRGPELVRGTEAARQELIAATRLFLFYCRTLPALPLHHPEVSHDPTSRGSLLASSIRRGERASAV